MEHLRRITWISVARGCGFGALAIVTTMIGFIATPGLAFDCAGIGFLLMAVILILKARHAPMLPYRRTEVWLMLDENLRPPPDVAQSVIGRLRAGVLLEFALASAWLAIICLALAFVLQVSGWR